MHCNGGLAYLQLFGPLEATHSREDGITITTGKLATPTHGPIIASHLEVDINHLPAYWAVRSDYLMYYMRAVVQ